jgi:hypothetical protein
MYKIKIKQEKRLTKSKEPIAYSTFLMIALLYIIMFGMLKNTFVI